MKIYTLIVLLTAIVYDIFSIVRNGFDFLSAAALLFASVAFILNIIVLLKGKDK